MVQHIGRKALPAAAFDLSSRNICHPPMNREKIIEGHLEKC
jgi:hypothetical protein